VCLIRSSLARWRQKVFGFISVWGNQHPHEENIKIEQTTSYEIFARREQRIAGIIHTRNTAIDDLSIAYRDTLPQATLQEGPALLGNMNATVYSTLTQAVRPVYDTITETSRTLFGRLSAHDQLAGQQLYDEARANGKRGDIAHILYEGVEGKESVNIILDDAVMVRHNAAVKKFGPDNNQWMQTQRHTTQYTDEYKSAPKSHTTLLTLGSLRYSPTQSVINLRAHLGLALDN
jgi:hypothetical protein